MSGLVGERMARLAKAAGLTMMPWQQSVMAQIAEQVEQVEDRRRDDLFARLMGAPWEPDAETLGQLDPERYRVVTDPWTELFGGGDYG